MQGRYNGDLIEKAKVGQARVGLYTKHDLPGSRWQLAEGTLKLWIVVTVALLVDDLAPHDQE